MKSDAPSIGKISRENVSVFTTTPHADVSVEAAAEYIKRQAARVPTRSKAMQAVNWVGATFIEIGCGAGLKTLPFALRGARVFGIDGSEVQISRAKAHAAAVGADATFIQGWLEDFAAIAQRHNISPADAIMCSGVIHHVAGWRDVLKQCARLLKPDGLVYLTWGDPSLAVAGFNTKNQIAYRLGWNHKSRLAIGTFLFGWWDRRRNSMKVPPASFYADLYSAYYIPISAGAMKRALRDAGLEVVESQPPMTVSEWRKNGHWLSRAGRLGDAVVRWRHFFRFGHTPRLFVCRLSGDKHLSHIKGR